MQSFFGQTGTHIRLTKMSPWLAKFSKFVLPNTLKMHSPVLSVLRFLCQTFPKSLKVSLRKTLFRGWFSKNSLYSNKKVVWL